MSNKNLAVILDFDHVKPEREYFRIARPPTLPPAIEDHVFIEAVREYLMGADLKVVGEKLRKGEDAMKTMVETPQWKRAEYLLRDDLRYTLYGQMGRMESTIVNQMWDRLQNGDTMSDMFGKVHRVPLSAVKLVEMHKQVTRVKDGLDKQMRRGPDDEDDKQGAQALLAALERYAEDKARAKTFEQEKSSALDAEVRTEPVVDITPDPHD